MADEINRHCRKNCALSTHVYVCVFYGFCFLFKRNENSGARWFRGGGIAGWWVRWWWWWKKKEFRHVVAYSTHICNAAYVHQLQLTFYLSELPITRTSWFFFHSQQSTLQSLCWLLRIYYYIYVHSRIQQQWTLSKVIFPGDLPAMHSFCVVP